jgi:hypothetical protein
MTVSPNPASPPRGRPPAAAAFLGRRLAVHAVHAVAVALAILAARA